MTGGLSARQVKALLKEHGSFDAAIEARPDLADELRDAQRHAEQFRKLFEEVAGGIARAYQGGSRPRVPKLLLPSPEMPPHGTYEGFAKAKFERDVRAHQTALDRHARAEAKKGTEKKTKTGRRELTDKQKLLHKHYRRATFATVLALLEQDKGPSEIAAETELNRQDVDKIRLWRDAEVYDLIAGLHPNTVILVRRPGTS